jgi:glycerol-3-phosphate acyltransferase PlsY
MKWFLFLVFAYLLGSVPTGLVLARLLGRQDPRAAGSGNLGATNVARTLGRKLGAATLVGDALKGFIPAAWAAGTFHSPWAVAAVAFAAYLGHLFPVYIGFQGGKGVATGLGVFLALTPGPAFWAAVAFAAVVWRWRMVSLGSLVAAAVLPLVAAFFREPLAAVCLALAVGALTFWRHQSNIERILAGSESRLGSGV